MLRPGDALYLPRGYLHSAVAQGEVSIHLTVGVHPLTAYDLARELIAAAAADRELRRSLPLGLDVTDRRCGHRACASGRQATGRGSRAGPIRIRLAAVARSVGRAAGRGDQAGAACPAWPSSRRFATLHRRHATSAPPGTAAHPSRQPGDRVLLDVMDSCDQLASAGPAGSCSSCCAARCSGQPTCRRWIRTSNSWLRADCFGRASSCRQPAVRVGEPGGAQGD